MNDDTPNRYAIERVFFGHSCEQEYIETRDHTATIDDLMLIPDAFLELTGGCHEPADYLFTIDDEWVRMMNCDEPDTYYYCEAHAQLMLQNLDPGAKLP